MSKNIIHILGNGDMAQMMPENLRYEREGKLLICNIPPFEVHNVYACCIVDFKMMKNLKRDVINLDQYKWVLGNRPKIFMDSNASFYIKHSWHIREFYTTVPKYCGPRPDVAATNFNCGHFATHYAMNKKKADEVHLWGFDSIMDHNMRSYTDLVLPSERSDLNNYKLIDVWRPIWGHMFKEFKDRQFVIHHNHANSKVELPDNVRVEVHSKK
jgi:hypothetical protein